MSITTLRHPNYAFEDRVLWRLVHNGGIEFVRQRLVEFRKREDSPEFHERMRMTYNPGHAANAVGEVADSIYGRMHDIIRTGGSPSYKTAITGKEGGVDLEGSSMNYYIGKEVLPEMLAMRRVGVFTDMPRVNGQTLMDVQNQKIRPYFYLYQDEEILNWVYDFSQSNRIFAKLVLREDCNFYDDVFGLPAGVQTRFRYLWLENGKCYCQFYDSENNKIDIKGNKQDIVYDLGINRIPFTLFEIPKSLYTETAQMQVTLMNMESTDINYILRANFPLYVEQGDPRPFASTIKPEGEQTTEGKSKVDTGVAQGRKYYAQNQPDFIHPSAEPLKASMQKQEEIKKDIRILTRLTLSTMFPQKTASSTSKKIDNQTLEAGLASIGMELQRGEQEMSEFWGLYEKTSPADVQYPTGYELKSDEERREEADFYEKKIPTIPSKTFQQETAKALAKSVHGHRVPATVMQKINSEIEAAPFLVVDPVVIQKDTELGILDRGNAGKARLYPDDAVTKANAELAARQKMIVTSQTPVQGAQDTQIDPKAANSKTATRDGSNDPNPMDKTRGAGK